MPFCCAAVYITHTVSDCLVSLYLIECKLIHALCCSFVLPFGGSLLALLSNLKYLPIGVSTHSYGECCEEVENEKWKYLFELEKRDSFLHVSTTNVTSYKGQTTLELMFSFLCA